MGQEQPTEMLYSGTYERTMDAKNRVAIPSAWVDGGDLHVIPRPSVGCLMVMQAAELDRWEQRIRGSGFTPAETTLAVRKFYGAVNTVTADKQGRILISDKQRVPAGLKGEVVLIGVRSCFEIWAKELYEKTSSEDTALYPRVAGAIGL